MDISGADAASVSQPGSTGINRARHVVADERLGGADERRAEPGGMPEHTGRGEVERAVDLREQAAVDRRGHVVGVDDLEREGEVGDGAGGSLDREQPERHEVTDEQVADVARRVRLKISAGRSRTTRHAGRRSARRSRMRSSSAFCQEYDDSGVPSVGQDSSTTCPGSAGKYAPTELAATSAGTRVRAIASASRRVPTTFVAHIARTSPRAG